MGKRYTKWSSLLTEDRRRRCMDVWCTAKMLMIKQIVALHYDWTDMDNAITNYSVWSDVDRDFVNKKMVYTRS